MLKRWITLGAIVTATASAVALIHHFKKGENKEESGVFQETDDMDYEYNEYVDESLSAYDAALIWASSGMDEDYMFGYSENQLKRYLYLK